MMDANGEVTSYCDCAKGTTLSKNCLHMMLAADHAADFDDGSGPLFDGEEPTSFLIAIDGSVTYFSVAANSGSARHHSTKRTVVTYSDEEWKCQSCSKDR
jgi:hypothetical protein